MSQSAPNNECALCLESADARGGGVPLISPGCCGKWFHSQCMSELVKKGNGLCPCCRAQLPQQLVDARTTRAPARAPVPVPSAAAPVSNVVPPPAVPNASLHVQFASNTNVAPPPPVPNSLSNTLHAQALQQQGPQRASHRVAHRSPLPSDGDMSEDAAIQSVEAAPAAAAAAASSSSSARTQAVLLGAPPAMDGCSWR